MEAPELSVVVVYGPLPERAAGAVRSLLANSGSVRLEIVLVRIGTGARPAGNDDPRVRHLELPGETTFGGARAVGVRAAQAPFVAFVEEHVRVLGGWADAVLAAHREGYAGVGYAVRAANPGVDESDLVGFLAYGLWYEPLARGETAPLPGHNSSLTREPLLAAGELLEDYLSCDLVFHERLVREGHRLLNEPAARIAHLNETRVERLAEGVGLFYRIYAVLRAREERWPAWKRLGYALATILIPFWSLSRTVRLAAEKGPEWERLVRSGLASVLRVRLAGAWGQMLGLLLGEGDARRRFTDYELSEPRPSRRDELDAGADKAAAA